MPFGPASEHYNLVLYVLELEHLFMHSSTLQMLCYKISRSKSSINTRAIMGDSVKLLDLPTELILMIAKNLSQLQLLPWSYTCRFFRGTLDTSHVRAKFKICEECLYQLNYNGIHLHYSIKCSAIRRGIAHHLEILRLLDRDKFLSPTKAICGPCANTHDRSMFSFREANVPNYQRQCLGAMGRFWICPHENLSHETVFWSPSSFNRHPMPESHCQKCRVNVHIGSSESTVDFPIFMMPPGPETGDKLAAKALSKLNLQICPHARLGDAILPDLSSAGCKSRTSKM